MDVKEIIEAVHIAALSNCSAGLLLRPDAAKAFSEYLTACEATDRRCTDLQASNDLSTAVIRNLRAMKGGLEKDLEAAKARYDREVAELTAEKLRLIRQLEEREIETEHVPPPEPKPAKPRHYVISGPQGSGKTAKALELVKASGLDHALWLPCDVFMRMLHADSDFHGAGAVVVSGIDVIGGTDHAAIRALICRKDGPVVVLVFAGEHLVTVGRLSRAYFNFIRVAK